ncbi:MAG: hypothetical protein Q9O24_00745 [Gammaproteobacteria bacterium]|nr:hypothetical protein [Gammaproteobacteria bacterium]MDQ7073705.1 hypothetical protein [Gammaproteobacteria bacterium]
MSVVNVVIPNELDVRLQKLMESNHSSRSSLLLDALQRYVEGQELLARVEQPTQKHVETEESYYAPQQKLNNWLASF